MGINSGTDIISYHNALFKDKATLDIYKELNVKDLLIKDKGFSMQKEEVDGLMQQIGDMTSELTARKDEILTILVSKKQQSESLKKEIEYDSDKLDNNWSVGGEKALTEKNEKLAEINSEVESYSKILHRIGLSELLAKALSGTNMAVIRTRAQLTQLELF